MMDMTFSKTAFRWGLAAVLIAIGFPLLFLVRNALFDHSPRIADATADPAGTRPASSAKASLAFVNSIPGVREVPAESCEGSIDTVNGKIPGPAGAPVDVDNVAAIYGWTAISTSSGVAPQAVYLMLTTTDGRQVFVATERASRPDLSQHYSQSALENAGFRQTVDLSTLSNVIAIGVARLVEGRLEVCKNLSVRLAVYDRLVPQVPGSGSPVAVDFCDGSVDTINGAQPETTETTASGTVSIAGWAAVSAREGVLPESVFITLETAGRPKLYAEAHPLTREDLVAAFGQPALRTAGFVATIDTSQLSGRYVGGISRLRHGALETCGNLQYRLVLSGQG
jgi:hypothetical protein